MKLIDLLSGVAISLMLLLASTQLLLKSQGQYEAAIRSIRRTNDAYMIVNEFRDRCKKGISGSPLFTENIGDLSGIRIGNPGIKKNAHNKTYFFLPLRIGEKEITIFCGGSER